VKFSSSVERENSPIYRSIRLENRAALKRRWRVAQQLQELPPATARRLFPSQGELLKLLSACTEAEVERMANVSVPLFTVSLDLFIRAEDVVVGVAERPRDAMQAEAFDELWQAMAARLDAIRQCPEEAQVAYHLSRSTVKRLSVYSPYELAYVALQPSTVMLPLGRPEFFLSAIFGTEFRDRDLHILATLQRGVSGAGVAA